MAAVMSVIQRIQRWLLDTFGPRDFNRVIAVDELYDVPERLEQKAIYVAGSVDSPKWAVFGCPCERPHRIVLSLQRSHPQRWRVKDERAGPTIYPSIDAIEWRRCHFWIQRGRVHWVPAWQDAAREFGPPD